MVHLDQITISGSGHFLRIFRAHSLSCSPVRPLTKKGQGHGSGQSPHNPGQTYRLNVQRRLYSVAEIRSDSVASCLEDSRLLHYLVASSRRAAVFNMTLLYTWSNMSGTLPGRPVRPQSSSQFPSYAQKHLLKPAIHPVPMHSISS
jgi:hypothetical protein